MLTGPTTELNRTELEARLSGSVRGQANKSSAILATNALAAAATAELHIQLQLQLQLELRKMHVNKLEFDGQLATGNWLRALAIIERPKCSKCQIQKGPNAQQRQPPCG